MQQVIEITNSEGLAEIRSEWHALLDNAAFKNPFLTYDWITTWLKHFWKDRPILFLLIRHNGTPFGLAPFLIDKGNCLIFPCNEHSFMNNFIYLQEKEVFVDAVLEHLSKKGRGLKISFQRLEDDISFFEMIESICRKHGFVCISRESYPSPYLNITTDWQTFLSSKSKHFRNELKRKTTKINKAGTVNFERITDAGRCESAMADIFDIERNSWKEKAATSFTAEAGLEDFYAEAARVFAGKGELLIYMLYFNSVPVAYIYGIVYNNTYYALKTSYHGGYRELSPGVIVFNYAFQDIFKSGLRQFDFLGAESQWKMEIASGLRQHTDIFVYPRNIAYLALKLFENKLKPLIKEKFPLLLALKRRFQRSNQAH